MSLTLVSCFFDLAKLEGTNRKTSEQYLKDAEFILSLDIPLVLYIEPEYVDIVSKARDGKKTSIIPFYLENSPIYEMKDKFSTAKRSSNLYNVKDTPNYVMLTWSKLHFVNQVAIMNPFNTSHIAWLDFGIKHVAILENLPFTGPFPDNIKLLITRWTDVNDDEYIKTSKGLVGGGFFTGSIKHIQAFYAVFMKVAKEILYEKDYALLEEQIIPILIDRYPDLFTYYYGDYSSILCNYHNETNDWFTIKRNLQSCPLKDKREDIIKRIKDSYNKGILQCPPEDVKLFIEQKEEQFNIEKKLNQYNDNPKDVLPLYEISNHYRNISKNYLSYNFAKMALDNLPSCNYSLQNKIKYELSIVCYYTSYKNIGRNISNELILDKSAEEWMRNSVRNNYYYYIQPHSNISETKIILKDKKEKYNSFNPSIIEHKGEYIVNVRSSNYTKTQKSFIVHDEKQVIRTENYISRYSTELKEITTNLLQDNIAGFSSDKFIGLEDIRLFNWKGKVWFTATEWNEYGQIVLGEISLETNTVVKKFQLIAPGNIRTEKNWEPYVIDDKVYFIYSHEPYVILTINDIEDKTEGKLETIINHRERLSIDCQDFRGSSPPIEVKFNSLTFEGKRQFLGNIHETLNTNGTYIHRWVCYDLIETPEKKYIRPRYVSQPFYFKELNTEFTCGILLQGDNVIIGYSQMDDNSGLITVKLNEIEKMCSYAVL